MEAELLIALSPTQMLKEDVLNGLLSEVPNKLQSYVEAAVCSMCIREFIICGQKFFCPDH